MLAKFLPVPLSEMQSNGFMAISKRRFKSAFTMADLNKGRLSTLNSYIQKGKLSFIMGNQSKSMVVTFL